MTRTQAEALDVDDAELIRRSLDDPEQFAALFDRHVQQIHHYVARRLGTHSADDIAAETFLIAFRRRASYDLTRPLARPWLYGIATTLMARHRRDEERFLRALSRTGVDRCQNRWLTPRSAASPRGRRNAGCRRRSLGCLAAIAMCFCWWRGAT
ncbi:RNA polymerase sigma factor [Nonomuraea sp. NPDC050556]|uniref:RNA polymerase sigma factor n=1 Tax=Nonomuraea sp. NPDC050556 TaxID=3364369 RepID=UPI00379008D9